MPNGLFADDENGLPSSASIALLVVDMQYFDAHRDWGEGLTAKTLGVARAFDDYFGQIDRITPRIARLIELFRAKNIEVVHLRVAELTRDSRDVGLKQLVRGLVVPIDSKEAEFLPTLEPAGDEIVINKSSSGVFASTNIDRILRNIGIRTLVFCGTSTSGCIQSAVYDATDLGYRVLIADDACADATLASQFGAVEALAAQAVTVASATAIEAAVTRLPAVDPAGRSGLERMTPYCLTEPYLPNDRTVDEAGPYSLIFGPAIPLPVPPASTALVLVDVQRAMCEPAAMPAAVCASFLPEAADASRLPVALGCMARLLRGCRDGHYAIIHIRTAGWLADGRDLSPKRREQGVGASVDSPQSAFMPEIAPSPGEIVLNKPGSSIFNGTGLDLLLQNLGIETLIVAGTSYDGTIESSLRSAGDRGYGTVIVPDACIGPPDIERQFWQAEKGLINVRGLDALLPALAEPFAEPAKAGVSRA